MRTIGEILAGKRLREVVSADATDTVLEAVRRMDQANTGAVVVLDGNRLAGIFTERDLMRRVVLCGRDVAVTRLAEVMTRDLVFSEPGEAAEEAMAKITRHRCRHPLPEGIHLLSLTPRQRIARGVGLRPSPAEAGRCSR